jgi:mevalonate kinase
LTARALTPSASWVRRSGFEFVARSALPMGAGLGSSAAYSTCLATAFLLHFKHITAPALPPPSTETHKHISHRGRRAIGQAEIDIVDQWAFLAEKVIHGNPSGIDNAVSVRGGAVAFRRKVKGVQEGGMEGIKSCVPRNLARSVVAL